jgi:hypothetical protein
MYTGSLHTECNFEVRKYTYYYLVNIVKQANLIKQPVQPHSLYSSDKISPPYRERNTVPIGFLTSKGKETFYGFLLEPGHED